MVKGRHGHWKEKEIAGKGGHINFLSIHNKNNTGELQKSTKAHMYMKLPFSSFIFKSMC